MSTAEADPLEAFRPAAPPWAKLALGATLGLVVAGGSYYAWVSAQDPAPAPVVGAPPVFETSVAGMSPAGIDDAAGPSPEATLRVRQGPAPGGDLEAPLGATMRVATAESPEENETGPAASAELGADGDAARAPPTGVAAGEEANAADATGTDIAGVELDGAPAEQTGAAAVGARRERLAHFIRAGNYQRGRGRWSQARRSYEQALRLSPENGRALAGLTKIAMAQHRGAEAVRYARRLVRAHPRNAANRVLLGDALRVKGDRAGARRAYEAALRVHPSHPAALRRLGRSH